ncbi:glycoprotein hormone alpha-2 isoform X1 [Arapaima gigas]
MREWECPSVEEGPISPALQIAVCEEVHPHVHLSAHQHTCPTPGFNLLHTDRPLHWSYDGLGPGCHLFPFNVTIRSDRRGTCRGTHLVHACVGYCESSAFPSRYSVLVASNFTHNITSASRCCTISKDTKVKVRLDCPRGRHHDDIEILTAQACRCDMCRKSRY